MQQLTGQLLCFIFMEAPVRNLGPAISYPDWSFLGVSSVPADKLWPEGGGGTKLRVVITERAGLPVTF
jgi:hypothetical protein